MAPGALWRLSGEERCVCLTFDDGPTESTTPRLLDILRHHGVKATFFMVADNVRRYAGLMERVLEEGHAVGNHTYHHLAGHRHGWRHYISDAEMAAELIPGRLFRPPHGTLTPRERRAVEERGWHTVMYDVVTRDYARRITAGGVVANVRRYARPGSVIVFHDSLRSIDKLLTALPEAIEWLRSEGYAFRTLNMETGESLVGN
ncbi:MAG: polysaccharide deacetylase family protein [Muribaculaceae bacterium]|nr:polysaccharide deacetylase family protein [Muribaculaceae bacterium]